jgi:hypothetical protein
MEGKDGYSGGGGVRWGGPVACTIQFKYGVGSGVSACGDINIG